MCIFVLKSFAMKRLKTLFVLLFLLPFFGKAQTKELQNYNAVFDAAYQACPGIPKGLLEAISFTNTHCHHLSDANYFHNGPDAMPRAYGLMGLVKDGKGYFRENLHMVSELSGISESEILERPEKNVLAYAKAFERLANERNANEIKDYLSVIQQLSELPIGEEKDIYPMQSMLYSVCLFLNDEKKAEQFGFQKYDVDLKAVFAEHYEMLTASELGISRSPDYPPAIWDPAPECNWEPRTKEVSAVVIHYTEGSYAGCISWFKNCDAEVSAHYVIRSVDGQVTQMVREKDKAWHARSANGYTIGIEHEAYGNIWEFFTEAMYQSSANLVRSICSRYDTIKGYRTHDRDTLDNGFCINNGLYNLGGEGACIQIRGHQHYPDQSHTDPGPYWDWNYYYKQESTIELNFSSFSLETDFDFLWVYDGDNVFAPKIGRWNTQSPGTVQSSGNVMCVEFRSDCATTDTGWEASWQALMPSVPIPEVEAPKGLYPNPTNGKFTIYSESEGYTDVSVYDLYGNQMVPNLRFVKSVEIDSSTWPSGVYIVNYGAPVTMGKVVKLVKL